MRFKTLLFLCICLMMGRSLSAQRQQQHYIYIQSEKGQPFYVKHNGKVLSSTERGYIILPQLEPGAASITVGFPKDESHEAKFDLKVAKNDQGYLLKRSGSSKYALYNLQTFKEIKPASGEETAIAAADEPAEESTKEVQPEVAEAKATADKNEMMSNLQSDLETAFADKAVVTGPKKPASEPVKSGNSFASALDKVVVTSDDRTAMFQEDAPVAKPKATASKASRGKKEREPLTDDEKDLLKSVLAEESRIAAAVAAEESVKSESADEEHSRKSKKHKTRSSEPDFIEFQSDNSNNTEAAVTATKAEAAPEPIAEEAPAPKPKRKKSKVFDDTEHPANVITDDPSGYGVMMDTDSKTTAKKKKKKSDEEAATEEEGTKTDKKATRLLNSDCVNIMDDATFHKVLKKFVAANTDNSMIAVFKKQTRNYCLETAQIKTLGQLLTSDETRYRLLEEGYPKAYDSEKYGALESLLIDDYYKTRFKAMIRR